MLKPESNRASKQSLDVAIIALGSNEDWHHYSAQALVRQALAALKEVARSQFRASELFRSPCFPVGAGPDFVNAAAVFQTDLTPEELLGRLHGIEASLGRQRRKRWGARSVDLDLIACGAAVLPNEAVQKRWMALPVEDQIREAPTELILPHPRLQDRGFVLAPLAQIAPGWRHPVLGRTVEELLHALPDGALDGITPL